MIFSLLIRNRKMDLDKNLKEKKKNKKKKRRKKISIIVIINIFHCLRREALLIVTIKWYKIKIIKSSV